MALNIAYFGGADPYTRLCYGTLLSSVAYTVTGASAVAGATPGGAGIARIKANEDCYVNNNGGNASATNGVFLAAGDTIDLGVTFGTDLRAITG